MSFEESIAELETRGFSWNRFRDYFPFGDISLREGNFQKLLTRVLETLATDADKQILLDLVDTQNAVFLEQVWVQNEKADSPEDRSFDAFGHFITAQLQITGNLRTTLNFSPRDIRRVMLNLGSEESLLNRINQV